MKIQALVFSIMLLGALFLASPCLATDYYVYCVDGRILIDTRNTAKLKADNPNYKNVTVVNMFKSQKDAETRAKHAGGVGAKCK